MKTNAKTNRYILSFAAIIAILLVIVWWNLCFGSIATDPETVLRALAGRGDAADTAYTVIRSIRLPRICAAILLGGGLSVSGYLLQTYFGNPIAGPYVLGISSGAKLMVAILIVFLLGKGIHISSISMIAAAFAGSLLAMGFVLILQTRTNSMSMLIVCGILIGYICSAITDFIITFASDSNIVNLHNWSMGSFSGTDAGDVRIMAVMILTAAAVAFGMSKSIGALLMGENYARSMGVNVRHLRVMIILLSSILSACVTAFAGPVSFVGIAVPHLVRTAAGTSRPILMIPLCFLGGGAVTLFCDGIARTVFAPTEISISSVTALLLVPVVIVMMLRRRGDRE